MKTAQKAFTLVELAIVITIIGLLIGGVLKGQELLENSRMTAAASQIKADDTAALTFKDIYKALPGDLRDPQNFIQGCTTAPCNITGNGDGYIGLINSSDTDENNNFWLHMAKANLVTGVDPNMTFASGTRFKSNPAFKLGGLIRPAYLIAPAFFNYFTDPLNGHYYESFTSDAAGATASAPHKESLAMKYDLKVDDGKPLTGDVRKLATGAAYDPNSSALVFISIKTGF